MRNLKSMYDLAKAKAIELGPRKFKKLAGFALTETELKKLYTEAGFIPKRRVWSSHCEIWEDMQWARSFKVGDEGENVIFFTLDKADGKQASCLLTLTKKFPDMNDSGLCGVVIG